MQRLRASPPGHRNLAVSAERAGRADLVGAHEPRVASDVCRDHGGERVTDPSQRLSIHASTFPLRTVWCDRERRGKASFGQAGETQSLSVFINCDLFVGTQNVRKIRDPEQRINGLQMADQSLRRILVSRKRGTC